MVRPRGSSREKNPAAAAAVAAAAADIGGSPTRKKARYNKQRNRKHKFTPSSQKKNLNTSTLIDDEVAIAKGRQLTKKETNRQIQFPSLDTPKDTADDSPAATATATVASLLPVARLYGTEEQKMLVPNIIEMLGSMGIVGCGTCLVWEQHQQQRGNCRFANELELARYILTLGWEELAVEYSLSSEQVNLLMNWTDSCSSSDSSENDRHNSMSPNNDETETEKKAKKRSATSTTTDTNSNGTSSNKRQKNTTTTTSSSSSSVVEYECFLRSPFEAAAQNLSSEPNNFVGLSWMVKPKPMTFEEMMENLELMMKEEERKELSLVRFATTSCSILLGNRKFRPCNPPACGSIVAQNTASRRVSILGE